MIEYLPPIGPGWLSSSTDPGRCATDEKARAGSTQKGSFRLDIRTALVESGSV
jgi:hypothetical protein